MTTSLWAAVVSLGILAAGVSPLQKPAREHLIDLTVAPPAGTAPSVPDVNRLTLQAAVGGVADAPRKQAPIRISAPELDRPDYRIGDAVAFEVLFENVSDQPIAFPTMLDGSTVDRDMPGAAVASVALFFEDPILGGQMVSPQFLYGAREFAGSLITVQPGERARIRARGTWILSAATGTPHEPHWPRPLKVRAAVMLVAGGMLRISEHSNAVTPVLFGTNKR